MNNELKYDLNTTVRKYQLNRLILPVWNFLLKSITSLWNIFKIWYINA